MQGMMNGPRHAVAKKPVRLLIAIVVLLAVIGVWMMANSGKPKETSLDATLLQLEAAVQENPQSVDARFSIAVAYAARGYNQSAIQQFQEVLKLEENHQAALIGLGQTYLEEKKLDDALAPLLKVADLNKDNPRKYIIDQLEAVYYDLGVIYTQKQDYGQASFYLSEALKINSTDADALYQLGQVQEKNGELKEALASYERAISLVPNYLEVYRSMAGLYGTLGEEGPKLYAQGMVKLVNNEVDKAIADLEQAVKKAPEMGEAYQGYAVALETKGRRDEAIANYQKALEYNPNLVLSQLAVQRLQVQ